MTSDAKIKGTLQQRRMKALVKAAEAYRKSNSDVGYGNDDVIMDLAEELGVKVEFPGEE